jgi:hypothetical protein
VCICGHLWAANPELLTRAWNAHWISVAGASPFDYGIYHLRRTLGTWRTMLDRGLTTWAETADPTGADCHAWGASPNYEMFRIRAYLGKLTRVSGAIPHPRGEVAVSLALDGGKLEGAVTLPAGVMGQFEWHGQTRDLHPGENHLTL